MTSLLIWTSLFFVATGIGILLALLAVVASCTYQFVRSFFHEPEPRK